MDRARRWLAEWMDPPVRFVSVLVVAGGAVLWVASHWYSQWGDMWQGVYVEGAGAVMDLVVFGIIIGVMVGRVERRRQISSQQELIDDFKKWDSEEARYRIAGAVRRLNRLGRTSINFVGMEISAFSFRDHDIESIAGSKFYVGALGLGSRARALLRGVDFSFVDCSSVVFSAFNPLGTIGVEPPRYAQFRECRFEEANLASATFKGALMKWTEKPPEETGDWGETRDGEPIWVPTYRSPFHMADLSGTSFEDVAFQNADFRDATNLDECRFAGATGLEDCVFDCEEDKERVLEMARTPAR